MAGVEPSSVRPQSDESATRERAKTWGELRSTPATPSGQEERPLAGLRGIEERSAPRPPSTIFRVVSTCAETRDSLPYAKRGSLAEASSRRSVRSAPVGQPHLSPAAASGHRTGLLVVKSRARSKRCLSAFPPSPGHGTGLIRRAGLCLPPAPGWGRDTLFHRRKAAEFRPGEVGTGLIRTRRDRSAPINPIN